MTTMALARRARWEVERGDPFLAVTLLTRAADDAGRQGDAGAAMEHLQNAMDLCLRYLPSDDDETFQVASRVSLLSGGDGRAAKAIGVRHSLLARRAKSNGRPDEAREEFVRSETALRRALELLDEDADAYGCLAGLYRRRAGWIAEESVEFEDKALAAYLNGARRSRSAYLVLNAIEYRAFLRHRRQTSANTATPTLGLGPDAVLFESLSDPLREQLDRALFIRRKQFERGEDAPWPAFDLARGVHYLNPNVVRLRADLDVAIEEVRRAARGPSDSWMLESAARSYRDLYEAGVPIDGVDDAMHLLRAAALDDRWARAEWRMLVEAREPYLAKEMGELRLELERLWPVARHTAEGLATLECFIDASKRRWTVEDEERFQRETDAFLKGVEPAAKRIIRTTFKVAGSDAASKGLELALAGVPAGGLLAKVVSNVLKEVVERAMKSPAATP